jgi:hypothetical protein
VWPNYSSHYDFQQSDYLVQPNGPFSTPTYQYADRRLSGPELISLTIILKNE